MHRLIAWYNLLIFNRYPPKPPSKWFVKDSVQCTQCVNLHSGHDCLWYGASQVILQIIPKTSSTFYADKRKTEMYNAIDHEGDNGHAE